MSTTAKQRVYKSPEGQQQIQNLVHAGYEGIEFDFTKRTVDSDCFGTTFICECGNPEGQKLVLLHGTSSNSLGWMEYIQKLKDDYHIFAIDLPGQPGLSSGQKMSFTGLLEWLVETIGKIELKAFHLIGMSLGGSLAITYAAGNADRVSSLTLITCGAVAQPKISGLFRIIFNMFRGEKGIRRIEQLLSAGRHIESNELLQKYTALVNKHFVPFTDPVPLLTDHELAALTMPIFYLAGEKDILLNTKKTAARLAEKVKGVNINVLKGYGHIIADQGARIHSILSQLQTN